MVAKKAKKKVVERVSQAEFARRQEVTRAAVTYAIQSGRIQREDDGTILYEQALIDWDANADIAQQRKTQEEDWKAARTRREIAEADMAELKYQEQLGSMVSMEEVRQALSSKVKTVRDRILGTARRLAPALVGKKNEAEVADKIYHELEDALKGLSADYTPKGN